MAEIHGSLWAQVWRQIRSRPSALAGLVLVLAVLLIGIYAPFLAGEVALVWLGPEGLSFPVFADLLNRWSYAKPHDLLFNLLAVLLPFLLTGAYLLRRRWSAQRRLLGCLGLLLLVWVGCMLPVLPSAHGWQAAWRKRGLPTATVGHAALAEPGTVRAIFPPIAFRFDTTTSGAVLQPPLTVAAEGGRRFWLGTDSAGKDVAAQLVMGARISLTIGLVATGLSLLIGVLVGAASGYFGGKVDLVLQRLVEIMMCFPTFILILIVVAMLERDIFIIMAVIGLTSWAGTARLVRGEFLAQTVRDYVVAAEALGVPRRRIMFRHILPNALTPLLISATFGIAGAVGSESGLAFLGLGDPTSASWGTLLEQGRQNIRYSWLIYAPGLAVFLLITALNLLGNTVREALDPKAAS